MRELRDLEKAQTFDTLIIIYERPGINRGALQETLLGSIRTSVDRINELILKNLIEEKINPKTKKNGLFLTIRGEEIAKLAIKMKNVLEDIKNEPESNHNSTPEKIRTEVKP